MKIHMHIFGVAQLLIVTVFVLKSTLAQNCTKNADCGGKMTCCPGIIKTCDETCVGDDSKIQFRDLLKPICNGGKTYKFFPGKFTWFQALLTCCNDKGMLPEVTSKEEAFFLRNTELGKSVWIGGHSIFWKLVNTNIKDRTFEWVGSGNPVNISHLEKFQANNEKSGESCLGGIGGNEAAHRWNDLSCTESLGVICHYPKIKCP